MRPNNLGNVSRLSAPLRLYTTKQEMEYPVPESHGHIMSDTERPDNDWDVLWDPLLGEFLKTKDTVLILRERCWPDAR